MWLSILLFTVASICLGCLFAWIASQPRRWDYVYEDGAARPFTMREADEREEPKASLSPGR